VTGLGLELGLAVLILGVFFTGLFAPREERRYSAPFLKDPGIPG